MPREHIAKTIFASALFAFVAVSAVRGGSPQLPTFHVTELGDIIEATFPGVEYPNSKAQGVNENGDMIGEASLNGGQMQAWVYTVEHGLTPLPLLAPWSSNTVLDASDRDENGEIVIVGGGVPGVYVDLTIGEAALWRFSTVTGEVLEVRGLGIPAGYTDSLAMAVNNSGTIVGFSHVTGPFTNWKYEIDTQVLETFDFPYRVKDLNNVGQICGWTYRGDLFGNYEDLADLPNSRAGKCDQINDQGWIVGRAGTGQSDGAGHWLVAIVRYADPYGWTDMEWISHLSLAGGINNRGDFMSKGRVYLEDGDFDHDPSLEYPIGSLISPLYPYVGADWAAEINNNRQVAAEWGHAILLTPLGEMIIPGDVNGDVSVDLDDHCAWVANPIDLNGDGIVDAADEQWMIERLLVFGCTVDDCNANGAGDHCDILDGLSADCDENDMPDECQPDCSGDGYPDVCESDCNTNGTPDPCDILDQTSMDCNANGIPDECDATGATMDVVNVFDPPLVLLPENVIQDDFLVTGAGAIGDVDFTLHLDYRIGDLGVQLSHGGTTITILDRPGVPDDGPLGNGQLGYDIVVDDEGTGGYLEEVGNFGSPFNPILSPPSYQPDQPLSSFDGMPADGVWTVTVFTYSNSPSHTFYEWGLSITTSTAPTSCDCNNNGVMDVDDIAAGTSLDCDANAVPDECEIASNDCNGNSVLDACDVIGGTSADCNSNNVPDECDVATYDCNGNGSPDECDVASGTSGDCDNNGLPDECDLVMHDCNNNGVVDGCDIAAGMSEDCNWNVVPDECEMNPDCHNDDCADAIAICPGVGTGSTTTATPDGWATCVPVDNNDVYYTYTPGSSGTATIETCGSPFATLMSVHTGCPASSENTLECERLGCDINTRINMEVEGGVTYLIRVSGWMWETGDFTLTLLGPACEPSCTSDAECDDQNPCTDDICGLDGMCGFANNTAACEDGNSCTVNDVCANGVCTTGELDCTGVGCEDCNGNGRPDACDIGDGTSVDANGDGIPDECDATPPPAAQAEGGRYFGVTPTAGTPPVAFFVTGDAGDASASCMALYVQPDGTLGAEPVFQTPAAWGDVHVYGTEVHPDTTYAIQSETQDSGLRSSPATLTTWLWGETNNNGVINLADVQLIILGFQGVFEDATLESLDLAPCMPNGIINLEDALLGVQAFQGLPFPCAAACE